MEIFVDIKGYEGLYQISNYGRIKSFPRRGTIKKIRILKPWINCCGYEVVLLNKKYKKNEFKTSRLVALHFIDNPLNKRTVNHKDGNKLNNHVSNLEWMSYSENIKHAYANGLMDKKGEKHPRHRLTEKQVVNIRKEYNSYNDYKKLAMKYNVSKYCIWDVIKRRTWKYIN